MCKHAAVSFCCETEANTTLQSNYTPAKNNDEEKRSQLSLFLEESQSMECVSLWLL